MERPLIDRFRRRLMTAGFVFAFALPGAASAQIAPECRGVQMASDYDEVAQQDFMANYVGLTTTLSPLHGPIPHAPGRGSLGLDLNYLPPLSCARRLVLNGTKTEDTNKTPVVPRLRAVFAFPAIGKLMPYAGLGYLPPIPVFGTTNVILSGEVGVGMAIGATDLGLRFHATSQKTVGEVATPFDKNEPAVIDLFLASSMGVDLLAGWHLGPVDPYVSLGLTDLSTFFYIGDDGVVTNNYHPYFGPVMSAGAAGDVWKGLRLAGEVYAAPGGYSMPDASQKSVSGMGRYGSLVTARLMIQWVL